MPALWQNYAVAVLVEPTRTRGKSARGHEKQNLEKVCVMNLTNKVLCFRV